MDETNNVRVKRRKIHSEQKKIGSKQKIVFVPTQTKYFALDDADKWILSEIGELQDMRSNQLLSSEWICDNADDSEYLDGFDDKARFDFYTTLSNGIDFERNQYSYVAVKNAVKQKHGDEAAESLDFALREILQMPNSESFVQKRGRFYFLSPTGLNHLLTRSVIAPEWNEFLLESLKTMNHNLLVLQAHLDGDMNTSYHLKRTYNDCLALLISKYRYERCQAVHKLMNLYKENWRCIVPMFKTATAAYRRIHHRNPSGSLIQNCTFEAKNSHAQLLDPLRVAMLVCDPSTITLENREAKLKEAMKFVYTAREYMRSMNLQLFEGHTDLCAQMNFDLEYSRKCALDFDAVNHAALESANDHSSN